MPLDPRNMTWAALLAHWVEFARSSLALPDDAQGRAWKAAVPDIIGLQAVAMALGETNRLSAAEKSLGLDRARVLLERHEEHLQRLFPGLDHPLLVELLADVKRAIAAVEADIP